MRRFLFIIMMVASLPLLAQESGDTTIVVSRQPVICIGYLSYDSALVSMPEYENVQQQMKDLRAAYDAEMKRVEKEFNQKYEAFLEGQKDFPRTILLKRQTELQELLERNIQFKNQGRSDLHKAEREAMKPLQAKLKEAIAKVAQEQGLALVVNTDSNACPFIEPLMAVDITLDVKELLNQK